MAIWNKRSEHDLIGNSIGVSHGQWLQPGFSGVGAGIDSFFEYGMKAAILLGSLYATIKSIPNILTYR
jgi:mannosidase alpha-like ER degradation enhancer 1